MEGRFWSGATPLRLSGAPPSICRVCALGSSTFALTAARELYEARLDRGRFERVSDVCAIDVAPSPLGDSLLFVRPDGRVFEWDPRTRRVRREIELGRRAESVRANAFGALFVDDAGRLWASGRMPQLSIGSDLSRGPERVAFFEGRRIYRAAVGRDFAAVVARKVAGRDSDDQDEDANGNDDDDRRDAEIEIEDEVFARTSTSTSTPPADDGAESDETSAGGGGGPSVSPSASTEDSEPTEPRSEAGPRMPRCGSEDVESDDVELRNRSSSNSTKRPTPIFINAEAAKQFLTRQLSWVSAGEDYLVECTERPTRIFKENVSNLTNLVVEGVKTVGDKVATLSRHMSGGSESGGNGNGNESATRDLPLPPPLSLTGSRKLDEAQASSSTVSDHRQECPRRLVEEKAAAIVEAGRALLEAEVWTWGSASRGQLGTGDCVGRSRPALVSRLANLGVRQVSCGASHCAALTLDGRAFLWGKNEGGEDRSGPVRFAFNSPADRIRDLTCGDDHSLLFTLGGTLFYQGKREDGSAGEPIELNRSIESAPCDRTDESPVNNYNAHPKICKNDNFYSRLSSDLDLSSRILASEKISYFKCRPRPEDENPILQDLAIEQQLLEEMISVHRSLIKPLLKKTVSIGSNSKIFETLCADYADIMYFTAVNVLSFLKFVDRNKKISEIALIQHCDEHLSLYRKYSNSACGALSIGGFQQISAHVEVPNDLHSIYNDKLPTNAQKNVKKISEAVISCSLLHPLSRLNTYKRIIQSILRYASASANVGKETKQSEQKLSEVLNKWDLFNEEYEKRKREAEATKAFWDTSGRAIESYRIPERRLIRESKSHPLSLHNSGRFSSHWFILFDDLFVHVNGSVQNVHKLATLWIESIGDEDGAKNGIQLIAPEETIAATTPTSQEKNEWLSILQTQVKIHLGKTHCARMPIVRTASYSFTNKSQTYKDAAYTGRWNNGKMHGAGRIEWPDGRTYCGNFTNNQIDGNGKMDIPNIGTYEGQWKDNLQNGFGAMKYCSGDVYEGYFKDGLAHGYGVRKQGDFTSVSATVYMGDWAQGVRQGYGVMDDIGKGEKYLGTWNDNKKHGCGIIVTLDGIYYEGVFSNDVLTGHGIMIFEDGTHYEGEFRSAGVFSGKGTLTFSSGDKIEGTLNGAWNDGVKINNATLNMNVSNPIASPNSKPSSFGKLCVLPNQKWNGLFRQCFQQIGVPDYLLTPTGNHLLNFKSIVNNKKIWQNIAVVLSQASNEKHAGLIRCDTFHNSVNNNKIEAEKLNMIPGFGQTSLTEESYNDVKIYLSKACDLPAHPLARLITGCCAAFCTSYGGVRVHPLLLSHAVAELRYLTNRLYFVIKILFPALPGPEEQLELFDNQNDSDDLESSGEIVTASNIVQPLLLPRVHSALHVLYALHHQREDVAYWKRLLKWNRQTDITLMAFLGIDQKFWIDHTTNTSISPVKDEHFSEAVDTLQQLKTTFLPMEKLLVIKSTFQKMTKAMQNKLGDDYLWTMDELFPIFHFVVVRARILQLGSEIHFVEDFMEPSMENGELGIMFTTLKACYYQILQEKNTLCD